MTGSHREERALRSFRRAGADRPLARVLCSAGVSPKGPQATRRHRSFATSSAAASPGCSS